MERKMAQFNMYVHKRQFLLLILGIGIGTIFSCFWYIEFQEKSNKPYKMRTTLPTQRSYSTYSTRSNKLMKVVFYQTETEISTPNSIKRGFSECEYSSCAIETISDFAKSPIEADAVIFRGNKLPKEVPVRRSEEQLFVFSHGECPNDGPSAGYKTNNWKGMFNLTMTYRSDSDIVTAYSWREKLKNEMVNKNFTNIFKAKSKTALWIVSNCRTNAKREQYVKALSDYIDIDIFGKCTNRPFVARGSDRRLRGFPEELKQYKFYLGFENNLCKDYVTEKFSNLLGADIVTVVRGGANYTRLAPSPLTYINTADFNSPKELADYLKYVGNNEKEYTKYLKEKNKYKPWFTNSPPSHGLCKLCEKLHTKEGIPKIYNDIDKWWSHDMCYEPSDIEDCSSEDAWTYLRQKLQPI